MVLIFSLVGFLFSCNSYDKAIPNSPQPPAPPVAIQNNQGDWLQHVDYKMNIDMDVNSYQYNGDQTLVYTNNSPDVLNRVYYHLYFNAF